MNSSRVFILGAGFSKQAHMPLATELTPLLLQKFKEYDDSEALSWFESVNERVSWINKHKGTSEVPSLNVEELFDIASFDALMWKMRQQMCPLGRNAGDTPYSTATAIESWLSYMEDDLVDVIWIKQLSAVEHLQKIQQFTSHLRENDTVITFNYDTLIEQALSQEGIPWHYGFRSDEHQGVTILKMHGSINWLLVLREQAERFNCSTLFRKDDENVKDGPQKSIGKIEYDYVLLHASERRIEGLIRTWRLQQTIKQYSIGIAGLGRYKPLDRIPGSGHVWDKSGRALYRADEIYIVGFSLSPFDTMARLHFASVMFERNEQGKIPKKIVIIDPSACSLKPVFQSVFGSKPDIVAVQDRAESFGWNQLEEG